MKIIKSISLIILAFLITSCSNNSAMKPEDFKNKEAKINYRRIPIRKCESLGCFAK